MACPHWDGESSDIEQIQMFPTDPELPYWTILILAPRRKLEDVPYPRLGGITFAKGVVVGTLTETVLSGIYQAMSWASRAWVDVGDYLEQLLDSGYSEDMLGVDDDFSQSRKCFWVINSIDTFERDLANTIEQWDWYYKTYDLARQHDQKVIEWVRKINAEQDRLQSSERRFKALRERARSLRDGVSRFPWNGLYD